MKQVQNRLPSLMCQCDRPKTFAGSEDYCDDCGRYVPLIRGGQGRTAQDLSMSTFMTILVLSLLFILWLVAEAMGW